MRRRDVIAGFGAAAWPQASWAQQAERVRQVGVLDPSEGPSGFARSRAAALRQGLAQFGWIEGRNVQIGIYYGPREQIGDRAAEVVRGAPDVIVAYSGIATRAVQQRTRTIPIVFVAVGDPVENGIVKSIARPEGNVTGFTNLFASFGGKWVELLKEVAPQISRIAVVWNPGAYLGSYSASIETAAKAMAIEPVLMPVRTPGEIDLAIKGFAAQPNGGLLLLPAGALTAPIVTLAVRHKLPSIGAASEEAALGALLSYGSNRVELFRDAAAYVDRVLRGAKVSDLPVQFPTRFELIVNLKTAKALGLVVPPTLLARADEVIE